MHSSLPRGSNIILFPPPSPWWTCSDSPAPGPASLAFSSEYWSRSALCCTFSSNLRSASCFGSRSPLFPLHVRPPAMRAVLHRPSSSFLPFAWLCPSRLESFWGFAWTYPTSRWVRLRSTSAASPAVLCRRSPLPTCLAPTAYIALPQSIIFVRTCFPGSRCRSCVWFPYLWWAVHTPFPSSSSASVTLHISSQHYALQLAIPLWFHRSCLDIIIPNGCSHIPA